MHTVFQRTRGSDRCGFPSLCASLRHDRSHMVDELRRKPFPIRLHKRQIHREVAYIAGQHHFTLAVENVRDCFPLCDDGLPCLFQLRVLGIDDAAGRL